jgi:ABC-2 type transport system ATP-binding protein
VPAALTVRDLVQRYGETTAVDGLSFTAASGQVTAILGPNGAGKTTTVEICAGLCRPGSGEVRILGHEAGDPRIRARVGVMPQATGSGAAGVYPSARPRETLELFAALYAEPAGVEDLLRLLDLDRVARTPWRRLSGGEQQRLSLALALVGRPEIVFLDEPTAGLDLHARRATWTLIEELRAAGVTVVLTTHAMDEAERLADHVVIVDRGREVAVGSPAELTRDGGSLEDLFLSLTAAR